MTTMVRQGDILLELVETVEPAGSPLPLDPDGAVVLARGEATLLPTRELGATLMTDVLKRNGLGHLVPKGVDELAAPLKQAWEDAGLAYCFDGWALVVGRPKIANFDEQGRLDNATGPALVLADDRPLYFRNGLEVPADLFEKPDAITPERIRAEPNIELRNIMLERMGVDRLVATMGAVKVHSDETATVWRFDLAPPLRLKELLAKGNYAGLTEAERRAVDAIPEHQDTLSLGLWWHGIVFATGPKAGRIVTMPPHINGPLSVAEWLNTQRPDQGPPFAKP